MRHRWFLGSTIVIIVLFTIAGLSLAQEQTPRGNTPESAFSIQTTVGTSFLYQGRLLDGGRPAKGIYDFRFRLYNAQTGGSRVGPPVYRNNVPIQNGLFDVVLDFGSTVFQGYGRWLEIAVRPGNSTGDYTVLNPRQPIYAVPYALSLRPGATIRDSESTVMLNRFANLPSPTSLSWKYGIFASSDGSTTNTSYIGVAGIGRNVGVYGSSMSADGYGGQFINAASGGTALYARAKEDTDADLVLGGTSNANDNGVIASDPHYLSSDIVLRSNDTVRVDLDADGNGEDADFEIRDKDGNLIFNVDDSGAVISALPRPAYDSGWQSISQGQIKVFVHNLGGSPDNYVVDMTCKSNNAPIGINQLYFGGDSRNGEKYGAYWRSLTSTRITVYRMSDDEHCDKVRVRIWVYK